MQRAGEQTRILRTRKNLLFTFGTTKLPYVCISTHPKEEGDIVIRNGVVETAPPQIIVPGEDFRFEGFEDYQDDDAMLVLLARRIAIPPAHIKNQSSATEVVRMSVQAAVERSCNRLDQSNDSRTAVIIGPDDVWNLSVLLYVGSQITRSASSNIQEYFERITHNRSD